jgi:hypothetical protein
MIEERREILLSPARWVLPLVVSAIGWFAVPVEGQVVEGRLFDNETRAAVVNGTVALRDSLGAVVARAGTDEEGRFSLEAPAPGAYSVLAAGMGYRSTPTSPFMVEEEGITSIEVFLHPKPIELDPLLVTAERIRTELQRQGFYRRKGKGYGYFISPDEIQRRPPVNELEVVLRAPFVYRSEQFAGSESRVVMRASGRPCIPLLFVDGIERTWWPGREGVVQDWVNFADIVAVEVYRGYWEIPQEWAIIDNTCGLIMIWTIWAEQRRKRRAGSGGPPVP